MSAPETKGGYERRDASRRLVAAVGIGLVVLTVGAMFLMRGLLGVLEKGEIRRQKEPNSLAAGEHAGKPPEPRLETIPGESLAALQAWERRVLESYGWVDRDQGVVRIPILRAMEILVQRGVPVHAPDEAP